MLSKKYMRTEKHYIITRIDIMFRIGTSDKIITPEIGIELCGYLARIQPSVGKYDELHARSLCLESDGMKILWIHCDLIGFTNDLAWSLRNTVAQRASIPIENIFLSATHTHSGPATVFLRKCGDVNPAFIEFLKKTIEDGAVEVVKDLEECSLHYAETTIEGISIDRRKTSKNSHIDTILPVIAFKRKDGSFKALIANYAMHNVGLSSINRKISADIAGFAASRVSSEIPGHPLVFMTNSGCANINPVLTTEDYFAVEKIGSTLSQKIIDETALLVNYNESFLSASFKEIPLLLERHSIDELEKMMNKHREFHRTAKDNYANNRLYEVFNTWYNETKEIIEKGKSIFPIAAYIHILKIGPVIFIGINAEVFSKMAEELRRESGFKNLYVVGYTDGCIGYMATSEIYEEGGYEVDEAHKFYGHFRLQKGSLEKLQKQILKIILQK